MTDILIGTHSRNSWQRPGTTATLRIWFSGEFRDTNGVMVDPGNGTSSFYKIVPCTVNPSTHIVTIPAFTLPSTLDGTPAHVQSYGRLYDASNAPREFLWTAWSLSNLPTSLPFDSWFIFNQGSSLSNPPDFYLNRQEVLALIDSLNQGGFSETPAGLVNGVNTVFTLSHTPLAGTLELFHNGQLQQEGVNYTISGATITFTSAPLPGDWLLASYRTASGVLIGSSIPTQVQESGGPTVLTFGSIPDQTAFFRSGSTVIGHAIPSTDELAALDGTHGTPSVSNKYVTDSDPRLPEVSLINVYGETTGVAIPTTYTRTSGSNAAGATTVNVDSGSTFADGDVIKITNAGPGGGVYRGIIVSGGGTTAWTVQPAIHTTVPDDTAVHHGDNNVLTKTSSSIISGAVDIPVVDASSFAIGQGIYIAGAGAASGGSFLPFIGTVLLVIGNTIRLTSGVTTGVSANALVMHDNTAAFAAAMAAAALLKCAEIVVPRGVYMVNGAGTGTNLHRICVPTVTDIANPITIYIEGAPRTVPTFPAFLANHGVTTNGTIIQSDGVGGSIIGGDAGGASFTLVDLHLSDLTFRTYDNPKIRGVDARYVICSTTERVMCDTGSQAAAATQPTDTGNFGLATGRTANGGTEVVRDTWSIGGWYAGFNFGEHTVIEGDVTSFGNYYAALLDSAIHPIYMGRLAMHECTRGIAPLSALRYKIGAYVIEKRWSASPLPAWLDTEWDIYDPSSLGSGEVAYHITEGSTNNLAKPFLVNGAIDLIHYPLSIGKVTNFGVPFSDNFNDNFTDTSRWTVGSQVGGDGSASGTVLEQNNRLEIAPQASVAGIRYRGYVAKDTFNLLSKTVTVRVSQVTSNGAVTLLTLQVNTTNKYLLSVSGTTLLFQSVFRGTPSTVASTTYNATNHLWWRIRHSGDQVVTAEVSADGSAWNLLGADAGFLMSFIQVRVSLEAGTESSIATPDTAFFEDFSIV